LCVLSPRLPLISVADALLLYRINVTDTAGLIRGPSSPGGQRRRHVIGRDISLDNQLDDANNSRRQEIHGREIKTRPAKNDGFQDDNYNGIARGKSSMRLWLTATT